MTVVTAGGTALVTGASTGIGAQLAVDLAAQGMTVGICARRAERLAGVLEACRRHTPASRSWTIDLSDLDAIAAFGARAEAELGSIDLLVNNAAMPKRRFVTALRDDEIDDPIRLNYLSPVRLTKAVLPGMLARGKGAVVCIGSVAARMSPPGETSYSASKAALTAFCEGLAVELWDTPVSAHVLHPGIIATELFDLPDNDPSYADDIEALPASAVTEALLEQLASGAFEAYVPSWFADIASGKAANLDGYLSGAAEYLRAKQADGDPGES